MKTDFIDRIEKIIADVRTRTGIDTEVLEVILQDEILQVELNEYYYEIFNEGYEYGLDEAAAAEDDAYSRGFEDGRAEAESDNEAYTSGAVEDAYEEGYSAGYSEGHSKGYDEGYDEGYADIVNEDF